MAVPLSMVEQIERALQTRLASIVADGANYNHTVDACLREPIEHGLCRDNRKNCIYVICPDEPTEEATELGSNKREGVRLRLELILLKKFLPKTEAPFDPALPERETVQNELVRDARKKIGEDFTLGVQRVENTEITLVDRSMEASYTEGWVRVRMKVVVSFEHVRTSP